MMKSRYWYLLFAAAFAAILLCTGDVTVRAEEATATQDEADEAAKTEEPESFTETVKVTARKREEDLQDVPISIAAPTEEVLRSRGAQNIEDVSANVAGFNVQNLGPGQSQVAMRGVSAGQIVRDQPGVKEQVGVYLDESVVSLSLFTPDIDLFDMSRIEVLRGPQGTLFGSGSLSGTVRYISNPPVIGFSETIAEFGIRSVDGGGVGSDVKLATNIPLSESVALRATAFNTHFGGYMDAVQPDLTVDRDVNSGDRTGVRLALKFQANENLSITPRIIYQEVNMDGWNRIDAYNIMANPFTTSRPAVTLGERQLFTQTAEPFTDEFLLADLNIEYVFGNMTLTSITSVTDRDVLVVRDATALTASITGGSFGFQELVYDVNAPLDDATTAEVLTQELRLAGATDSVEWVGGLFYSDIKREYGQSLFVDGFTALAVALDPMVAMAFGVPYAGPRASGDELFFSDLDYDFEQLALFGEVTFSVGEKVDLTGGLRFYDFEENRTQVFDGFFSPFTTTTGSTTADGVAPRVIASFRLNESTTLNAQISKGFRLGGINDPLNVPLCTPEDLATFGGRDTWEDEELWNYEVGSKSTIMGGRGTVNVALFYNDISDLQATVTAGSCSSRVVFNVPDARSSGIELEFSAQPNTNFDFAISASYTDSELQSTLTSTDSMGNVSIVSGIQEGNRLPTVPELQAAAAANYQWQMTDKWVGYVNGTFQHVGERYTQIGDQAAGFGTVDLTAFSPNDIGGPLTASTFNFNPELPAYDILNVRLGFSTGRWDWAFFVNNVTDERAFLALDQERGTLARVGYLTNQPRTMGISSRVNF